MPKMGEELVCSKRDYVAAKMKETKEFLTKEDEAELLKIPKKEWVAYYVDEGGDLHYIYSFNRDAYAKKELGGFRK